MITQNPLTWAVTGPDPDDRSKTITASINDPKFYPLFVIMEAQQEAAASNFTKRDHYTGALNLAQASISAGRPDGVVAPVKPKMTLVDDFGVSSDVDFVPPLPDLVFPPPPPAQGIVNEATRPPDPNAVLAMQTKMLLKIAADVAAIKAKVGG
jgi:hypothetical protein